MIRAPVVPSLMSTDSPPTPGPMMLSRIRALSLRSERSLSRTDVHALAHPAPVLPGVVDPRVLQDAVPAGVAEVHALHVQVVHGHGVDHDPVRRVGHDPLLAAPDRDPVHRPVRGAVQVQPVAAARRQDRPGGAGEGDPRPGGTRTGGLEVPGVGAVGEPDRVAGGDGGERRLELGGRAHVDHGGVRRVGRDHGETARREGGGEQGGEGGAGAHGGPSRRGSRVRSVRAGCAGACVAGPGAGVRACPCGCLSAAVWSRAGMCADAERRALRNAP